jgi:sn-glycerol 3-phosphate transport system ATP-binding protein
VPSNAAVIPPSLPRRFWAFTTPPPNQTCILPSRTTKLPRDKTGVHLADVQLKSVTKAWGPEPAVNNISFTVRSGELAALLGPSGCGKSTTLRLIAGLDTVTAGTIHINGIDVTALSPARRNISMVFQSYALFPHLSVAENIVFGLKVRNVPAADRDRRLARAADILGLGKLLDRKPSQLSGGQQQRVALGRAIVAETPVCLMDEPLSNLDAQLRVEMRREIRALQQRLGITMIYVTHDQLEAMTMADQVILMRAGHIEHEGPPAELYERPATIFTARFVGTPPMNVLSPNALKVLPETALAGVPTGQGLDSLSLGVRAEAAHLAPAGTPAHVHAVEYLGADTLLDTRIAGEPFIVRLPGRPPVAAGDDIHLAWDPSATHWFDAKTGKRIN